MIYKCSNKKTKLAGSLIPGIQTSNFPLVQFVIITGSQSSEKGWGLKNDPPNAVNRITTIEVISLIRQPTTEAFPT